jgi:small-conductance mechanosensitive channel
MQMKANIDIGTRVYFTSETLIEVIAIVAIAWLIGHILAWAVVKFSRRAGVPQPQRKTISRWLRALTILIGVVGILSVVGLGSELELLIIGGIVALVTGIAFDDVFSNILSGFLTFEEDTLRLGDVVEVAGGAGKGHVVKVGLRKVWIKTESGALVVLGHATLENGRY